MAAKQTLEENKLADAFTTIIDHMVDEETLRKKFRCVIPGQGVIEVRVELLKV